MNWNKKKYGADNKPAELLLALDEGTKHTFFCHINNIYEKGKTFEDSKKNIMVIVPKKSKSTNCEEYRTLSILTHTSKILTKIILGRIEKKIDENQAEGQFGFRKNGGKREVILYLWHIVDESFTVNKKVYIAFVDLLKALTTYVGT